MKVINVKAQDEEKSEFYEVVEIIMVDGIEKTHRNADLAFSTREQADAWVKTELTI